jgi:2-polyprenyl-3-methyl-5-hydroxy-6-metoxy-1,4-benzoquinol methylase
MVSENIKNQDHVLEIAPGPGYTVIELAKPGSFIRTAMDLSFAFVETGRKNASDAGVNINFCQGGTFQICLSMMEHLILFLTEQHLRISRIRLKH